MLWWNKYVLRNELDGSTGGGDAGNAGGGGEGGGGIDMDAAVADIGSSLGLDLPEKDDASEDGGEKSPANVAEPVVKAPAAAAPAVSPTPTAAAPATPPAAPSATPPAVGAPARFTADAPPTTWTPAAAAKWAALDPDVRAEIARRENDMFSGLEQYKSGATFAREVQGFLRPVESVLAQHGVAPQQFLQNLVQGHLILADTSLPATQRQQIAANLLKSYGIELPPAGDGQPDPNAPYVDPEVKALRERMEALESTRQSEANQAAMRERQQRAETIRAFAEEPAHKEYFDLVVDDMTVLIRGSGGTMSLQDAFDKACYANPTVRAKMVAKAEAAAVEKAQKDAQERAAEVKKATATNVKTSGHQGRGTAPSESMEDTMKDTLAAINRRDRK